MVYLMKEKSKVNKFFVDFYNTMNTQFGTKIQALILDQKGEYINNNLAMYLREKGIIHQMAYIYRNSTTKQFN